MNLVGNFEALGKRRTLHRSLHVILSLWCLNLLLRGQVLDESWTFTVAGQTVQVQPNGSFRLPNISAPDQFGADGPGTRPDFEGDDLVRAIGHSSKGGSNRYAFSDYFRIRRGQSVSLTNLTFTDTAPRQPESLRILPTTRVLTASGQTNALRVIAHYGDGTTNDATLRTAWTSYRTSNPNIATVDIDGRVVGSRKGTVFITAVNEGTSAVVRLDVSPGDLLASIVGRVVGEDGSPVPNVVVQLPDSALDSVVTDAAGHFVFLGVATGSGKIRISAWWRSDNQLKHAIASVEVVPGGTTSEVTLQLQPWKIETSRRLAASKENTVAIRKDGSLWAWGQNTALPLDGGLIRTSAIPVNLFPGTRWQAAAAGPLFITAIRENGELWEWGLMNQVAKEVGSGAAWRSVAAGSVHALALQEDGTAWSWGSNDQGQLGQPDTERVSITPQRIGSDNKWREITAGDHHSVAISVSGTLWVWGYNNFGQLGNGRRGQNAMERAPIQLESTNRWAAIAAGRGHTLALTDDGQLWGWGANESYQLGDDFRGFTLTPRPILTNMVWQAVTAAGDHSLAIRDDGTLWGWGSNYYWESGNDSAYSGCLPQLIQGQFNWMAVTAGQSHSVVLRDDGSLWAWGWGYVGDGWDRYFTVPQPIEPEMRWIQVATTGAEYQDVLAHTLAIRNDGTLWAWGANDNGQLGDASEVYTGRKPRQVLSDGIWRSISTGLRHSMAIRADGSLFAWGSNDARQLGLPSLGRTYTPALVDSNTTWNAVAAGYLHTIAIRADGTLAMWGDASRRQFDNWRHFTSGSLADMRWTTVAAGYGGTIAVSTNDDLAMISGSYFASFSTKAKWISAAAGGRFTGDHFAAINEDGALWTWGKNNAGQLGDGSLQPDKRNPGRIQPDIRWRTVSAGGSHTVAITDEGALWAWGDNSFGQLGDATFDGRISPQPISANFTWQSVAAGIRHTLAIRSDGTLWGWGDSYSGQLGVDPIRQVLGGSVWGSPE